MYIILYFVADSCDSYSTESVVIAMCLNFLNPLFLEPLVNSQQPNSHALKFPV